jgi:cytochrome c oxidase cbb3-type subunit 4
METYTFLRQMADSWVLLALFVFFIGVIFWAFRPGSRAVHRDQSQIPFRHDDAPAPDPARGKDRPSETETDR